jgi:HAD superfamily hydrolase (TIGR01549 family)
MIFDIDGTLVDTNPAHVEAWRRAFHRLGYDIPRERIEVEIGKGGDKLVPSVLGDEAEARSGEELRKAQKEEFLSIAARERFRVFPGVPEIFDLLRERRIRTAVATSSDDNHLKATLESAGLDLARAVDVVVTKSPRDASKPDPDLIEVALDRLGCSAAECPMVGDTVYDGQASRAAGLPFLGVLTGGTSAAGLLQAGAVGVWSDVAHLLAELDRALELASLTGATTD